MDAQSKRQGSKGAIYVAVSLISMQSVDFEWLENKGFRFHHYRAPGRGATPDGGDGGNGGANGVGHGSSGRVLKTNFAAGNALASHSTSKSSPSQKASARSKNDRSFVCVARPHAASCATRSPRRCSNAAQLRVPVLFGPMKKSLWASEVAGAAAVALIDQAIHTAFASHPHTRHMGRTGSAGNGDGRGGAAKLRRRRSVAAAAHLLTVDAAATAASSAAAAPQVAPAALIAAACGSSQRGRR